MSLFDQFKTDQLRETKGILLEYGANADGTIIGIRIARAGGANKRFEKRMEGETKPIRRQIQNETIENAAVLKMMHKVWAETVVLGWENVQEEDGKVIPFSVSACIDLFERLPDLFLDIREQSQRMALFRVEVLEGAAKN